MQLSPSQSSVCRLPKRLLIAIACAWLSVAQAQPDTCTRFIGSWSGTWSQGMYGTQWIHVTAVSPDCIAQVGYNPTGQDIPAVKHALAINDGVIEFVCNPSRNGTCRLKIVDGQLRAKYTDDTGFENLGVFQRQP